MRKLMRIRESVLGEVLIRMGAITRKDLEEAIRAQDRGDKMIGQYLIDAGRITEPQLSAALRYQKKLRNGKCVDALIDMAKGKTGIILREITAGGTSGKI